ncbi:class I SAM-dependent methyltransferase [Streptomyces sp. NPDC093065]|uniref:class I SAM-dependent methyltransferase n=1 Tax=Streptomyces sp. NPDC093065 TaxID=3366021 RepID=UPI00382E754F
MPMSLPEGKDWSLDRFRYHLPNTVTDIGPGNGTYAHLFRPTHKGTWWTGIEIHKPYIAKYKLRSTKTRTMYDEIHVEDARNSEAHLFHRDLVICGDVLEHMPREDAVALLERIVAAGAWNILVSLPIIDFPQGEVDGNPHEAHLHQWDPDDMDQVLAARGGRTETMRGQTLGCWWWNRG